MTSHDPEAGQVPENLPGLTDPGELRTYERRAAYLRVSELEHHPERVDGDFDFPHLQAIHGYILQDVYPWAGQPRRPGQETAAMGMMHCRAEFLDTEIRRVFGAIDRHRPSSTDRDAAIATVADHWGELTALHPFADGNSRSQRLFFHRYLNASGWEIDWRRIDGRRGPRRPPRRHGHRRFQLPRRDHRTGNHPPRPWRRGITERHPGRPRHLTISRAVRRDDGPPTQRRHRPSLPRRGHRRHCDTERGGRTIHL